MANPSLCYRGIRYEHSHDQPLSATPIKHVCRGHHYADPLLHRPLTCEQAPDLIDRGTHHHPLHQPLRA